VDREPIDLEIGGDHFSPPALLSPDALADLIDMQADMSRMFGRLQAAASASNAAIEPGQLREILEFLAKIFDLILPEDDIARFRARLFDRKNPYDLLREVVPAVIGLIEEYTGRPTRPSPPSSTLPSGDGTTSAAGPPAVASTPATSLLAGSAT
jgi:hypothetical protein